MSYSYRAYGLGIDSTTSIAGLELSPPNARDIDLCFTSGTEPDWATRGRSLPGRVLSRLPESQATGDPSFVLTNHGDSDCFELSYSDGTLFVVDQTGQRVWGTFEPPLTPQDLATYFLGPVMGFLLRQRHVTCLHASAVEFYGQAVAFSGDAGFGKSTTAAALALRGIPVLSEDIAPLEDAEGKFHAMPGYPRVCLWPDSVEKLLGSTEALPALTPMWDKRYLPLDGVRGKFAGKKLPLGLVYLFAARSAEDSAPRIEEMRPRIALLDLVQNTYMNWLLDRERRAAEFDVLARLVKQVPVRRIVAHKDPKKISALCDLIMRDAQDILSRRPSFPMPFRAQ